MTGRAGMPRLTRILLLVGAALLPGCRDDAGTRQETTDSDIEIVDAAGRTVHLPGPARRVISLVPSTTLTLRALGATDRLVGRTDFDVEAWAADLPSVGGGLQPNLEAIVSLRPDLVIRFAGDQDRRTPARLDDLGIPHLAVRPDRIDDVMAAIDLLGRATGLGAAADSLTAAIRADLADVRARVAERPRKSVAYVLGGTPPWVAGPGTYIHELVDLAGGDNVFSDLNALYSPVSPEEIRSRGIDVVLVSGVEAFDASLAPDARVEIVDAALEIPGPALARSALRLAELLHGPLPPSPPSPAP